VLRNLVFGVLVLDLLLGSEFSFYLNGL